MPNSKDNVKNPKCPHCRKFLPVFSIDWTWWNEEKSVFCVFCQTKLAIRRTVSFDVKEV